MSSTYRCHSRLCRVEPVDREVCTVYDKWFVGVTKENKSTGRKSLNVGFFAWRSTKGILISSTGMSKIPLC